MITYFFIFLALLAIGSALVVITNRNTVNSALFLVLNMVALAGLFLILQAQFLAVIQILIYAGAIMVLFLFVIMLLNIDDEESLFTAFRAKYFVAFIFGSAVLALILYSLGSSAQMLPQLSAQMVDIGTVETIGEVMFSEYLLPFEIAGVLLTAAVVGGLLIAQYSIKPDSKND